MIGERCILGMSGVPTLPLPPFPDCHSCTWVRRIAALSSGEHVRKQPRKHGKERRRRSAIRFSHTPGKTWKQEGKVCLNDVGLGAFSLLPSIMLQFPLSPCPLSLALSLALSLSLSASLSLCLPPAFSRWISLSLAILPQLASGSEGAAHGSWTMFCELKFEARPSL